MAHSPDLTKRLPLFRGQLVHRGALLFPVAWNRQGWFAEISQGSAYDLAEQVVPLDDFLPVSDLLEEHGFDEVASFLRTLATAREAKPPASGD
jgi:hypothetical protein